MSSSRMILLILTTFFSAISARADGDPHAVTFEKHVLPIFQAKCLSCHDARKSRGALRLDVRSSAIAGGESRKVGIVPGKPNESELIRRLVTKDEEARMPPEGAKALTSAERDLLTRWVAAGAKWPDTLANERTQTHWAFLPPVKAPLPKTTPPSPNPIDAFVRARLAKEGLHPAKEADRVTLCRRLYLDLLGLPPSPEEVDAFLADRSAGAYENLVEKLLASPHYGERWGRLWLDAARYADSDGYEKDKPRYVWPYRDWVIHSLNRDEPYNQFIIDQIAGDLIPHATQDQKVATGYLRNSMVNEEGGIDPEQFRMEAMFDRMDAIGKGVLGLTIQCAQCHTHKFDPISHTEYYQLFAFLNNAHEANMTAYRPEELMQRAEILREIDRIQADLRHQHPNWREEMHAWEAKVRGNQPKWNVVKPYNIDGSGGQKNTLLADGSILASGYSPSNITSIYAARMEGTISAIRLEVLNDPSLPRGGPGRAVVTGLFGLTEVQATVTIPGKKSTTLKFASATSDAESPVRPLETMFNNKKPLQRTLGPAALAIDGKPATAWSIDLGPGRSNVPRKAVFVLDQPISLPKGSVIMITLVQNHGGWNSNDNQSNNLGRFRLSVTDATAPKADPLSPRVRELIEKGKARRTEAEDQLVFHYWRTTRDEWKNANDAIESAWKKHPFGSTQLVLKERDQPRTTHLLKRGDFLKPAEVVTAQVPAVLHPFPNNAPRNRLGFARWLVDPKSPTTARAYVNRVWQAYFGIGLVSTPEDFGTQSEAPSHPQLLDWLAVDFMEHGWSRKRLHRQIVMSATYRQSSKITPELAERDIQNRLLARGPRFRVDAEIVRDIALSASGLLNPVVGGPSFYPPVPAFLMLPPASYGTKTWPESTGEDRYRRSMYVFAFRSVPYPPLQAFDAPNGDFACVRRSRSNTPLQALTAMNEPVFVEAAEALAKRTLAHATEDTERLTYAFRCCVARKPTAEELNVLKRLLQHRREESAKDEESAVWMTIARVLLNLDEAMTKE